MAYPSVTYGAESPGGLITSTKWNQNFLDIINGITDGTKDQNINLLTAVTANITTLTVAGTATFGVKATMSGSNLAKTSAPVAATFYPNSIIKAWANILVTTNGTVGVVTDGFNISGTITFLNSNMTLTFLTAMGDANYMVLATMNWDTEPAGGSKPHLVTTHTRTQTTFKVQGVNTNIGAANWSLLAADVEVSVLVLGIS